MYLTLEETMNVKNIDSINIVRSESSLTLRKYIKLQNKVGVELFTHTKNVSPLGLEPRTQRLKVFCSTN